MPSCATRCATSCASCWPASSRNSMPKRRRSSSSSPTSPRRFTRQTEAVQQMEAEHGERTQRGYAIEREGQENREKLNTLALDLDRAAARRRTNEERCAELDARSAGAQAEIANTEEQLARLQQELETDRATLESANADVASCAAGIAAAPAGSGSRCGVADRSRAPAGSSVATRSCRPCRRLRPCATASPRPRSASPLSIASRSACTTRPPPPISSWKASADSAASLAWNSRPPRSVSTR